MSTEFPVSVGFEFLCLDIFGLVYLPDRCSHGFLSKEYFIVSFRFFFFFFPPPVCTPHYYLEMFGFSSCVNLCSLLIFWQLNDLSRKKKSNFLFTGF